MRVLQGDCLEVMRTLEAESFHAAITDPPYHLASIVKRFGGANAAPAQTGTDGAFARASRGFMGKQWDGGDIAFRPETWAEVYRVLKPGAFLCAFASTRGYHRMVCAIEDAGFVIHPMIGWLFGVGMPKATRFKNEGMDGWRYGLQALKPALEPICLAQKPLDGTGTANWLAHGCGGLNIDACRVEATDSQLAEKYASVRNAPPRENSIYGQDKRARSEGNLEPHPLGRWPANVLHDGSDEVLAAFAAFGEKGGGGATSTRGQGKPGIYGNGAGLIRKDIGQPIGFGDSGTAARFFYSAKASAADRAGSKHPTVKPLALMRWLCRLVTPPGGSILDPFGGSGSTLQAAHECGFVPTLIEREEEYFADIQRRIDALSAPVPAPVAEAVQADLFGEGV